jgi:hypothetical protein
MKTMLALSLSILVITSCGRNPHLNVKSITPEVALPSLEPQKAEPNVILREKVSKKEGLLDLGDLKVGDKSSLDLELVNVGTAQATTLLIPTLVGNFNIINIDCITELAAGEACNLRIELTAVSEKVEKESLPVTYRNSSEEVKLKSYLVASIKALIPATILRPEVIIIPKNTTSGVVYLKDVPLKEERTVSLEVRNIGKADAQNLKLPTLPAPYKMTDENCPETLAPDAFCEVNFTYSPLVVKDDELTFDIQYNDLKATQLILANAIKLDVPAKIEVSDGIITQDIYEIMNIKPEMLSPFQEVRGLDLGTIQLGKENVIKVVLNNSGVAEAKIVDLKTFQTPEFKMNGPFPGTGGSCALVLKKGSCTFEVIVTPKDLKSIHDLVEFTYEDGNGNTRRLSLVLFAAVKDEAVVSCKTLLARSTGEQSMAIKKIVDYKLPYKTKASKASLQVLFNTESNMNLRFVKGATSVIVPSVHNAMVQFGFNITKEELAKYKSVQIELDILKIGTEGAKFDTTEILCLNETKKCSGTFFIDSNYGPLNTPNYQMHSNFFSAELLRSSQTNLSSMKDILAGRGLTANGAGKANDTIFRLKKRFSLGSLYGNTKSADLSQGLNFILADDSHLLSLPKLILESNAVECKN